MSFRYDNLWKLLEKYNMTKTNLRNRIGISTSTLAKMSANQPVSSDVISKICNLFGCGLDDVVEYKSDIAEFMDNMYPEIVGTGYTFYADKWPECRFQLSEHQIMVYKALLESGKIRDVHAELEQRENASYWPNAGIIGTSSIVYDATRQQMTVSASFAVTQKYIEWFVGQRESRI